MNIIFDLNGKKIGQYEGEIDESSTNRSYLMCPPHAVHALLPEGMDIDCVAYGLIAEVIIPAVGVEGEEGYIPQQVIPEHNGVILDSVLVNEKIAKDKADQASVLYNAMVKEVYDAMELLFGTRNDVSAQATASTWQAMKERPASFVGTLGLMSEADVLTYATNKVTEVDNYGKWRMNRIAQFQLDKASI